MDHIEKLTYMKTSTNIVGFAFKESDLDLLVSTYEVVIAKKGDTNLHDLAKVKAEVHQREPVRVVKAANKSANTQPI